MKVLITDVTRMEGEKVCIAGLNRQTTLRLATPQPHRGTLERIGGLLPGDMLDISWRKESRPIRPHVEDGRWAIEEKLPRVTYSAFLNHLSKSAVSDIIKTFGAVQDTSRGGGPGFAPGRGSRSLATLRCREAEVYRDQRDKVRIRFRPVDSESPFQGVSVNDLAYLEHVPSCARCRKGTHFGDCLLRIGLGRPFAPDPARGESCWLQVNAILPIQSDWPHYYEEPAA